MPSAFRDYLRFTPPTTNTWRQLVDVTCGLSLVLCVWLSYAALNMHKFSGSVGPPGLRNTDDQWAGHYSLFNDPDPLYRLLASLAVLLAVLPAVWIAVRLAKLFYHDGVSWRSPRTPR
jgi:hypothetical protein